ncbi:aminotransferase class I/II-fold pyridoxal phosphate-dependent enzyme [Anaerobacillus sp. CMMVII]|uniref:aminotransferase class I/II-fold pyridoxal phosphate-dependent enzyme n=1 Tax=Anaerobacillus sp. CMMVII TaxID=2755588 RepID=UPI0021B7160F|nr:aminotransferase class I/II-fold pyridoxal phosphate-dependent enzyme [Anaerobacillus sp. CMMVII]MCT8136348.1 aminotransferase class I/II-fold pyridoxal phosphate-dependent enzyme [Anaerobacillus sp. CMMVII]
MNQNNLPLYEALWSFRNENPISLHVPGHKNGLVFPSQAKELYQSILSIDVTELSGLDDLHHASGVIKQAEDLTANLYGSKSCYFLVGGSTVGNIAMIMATCEAGDTVLVQRNSHKSVINGLRLAKVKPIFIEPDFDVDAQIATTMDDASVIEAINKYPEAKAIFMTRPNYYGYTKEIDRIVSIAHEHNMVVLVDEAHGAHFGHPSSLFPKSAIHSKADIVVQSAHKTLPAMTMCSFLHFNSQLVDENKLKYYLQLFQSSSPSYPLLASLDLARFYLANLSKVELLLTLEKINEFKKYLNQIPQLKVVENEHFHVDPLKVTVQSCCELNGFEVQKLLEEEGIYTEMADLHNVLFVLPLSIVTDLLSIGEKIANKLKGKSLEQKSVKVANESINKISSLALSYEQMENVEVEIIAIEDSKGKIISEEIIPYPPGVPLLVRGERIENNHIEQLFALRKSGAYFQGADVFKKGMKVFKNV